MMAVVDCTSTLLSSISHNDPHYMHSTLPKNEQWNIANPLQLEQSTSISFKWVMKSSQYSTPTFWLMFFSWGAVFGIFLGLNKHSVSNSSAVNQYIQNNFLDSFVLIFIYGTVMEDTVLLNRLCLPSRDEILYIHQNTGRMPSSGIQTN